MLFDDNYKVHLTYSSFSIDAFHCCIFEPLLKKYLFGRVLTVSNPCFLLFESTDLTDR